MLQQVSLEQRPIFDKLTQFDLDALVTSFFATVTSKLKSESIHLNQKETPFLHFHSKNSVWDTVKLLDRFQKPEYHSKNSKIELLRADAIHHAKEMALIEPITTFEYWHKVDQNKTLGAGYSEDMALMLNTFTQEIAKKGLSASRASVESLTFERAKQFLTHVAENAIKKNNLQDQSASQALLITSFPDEIASGYHGSDTKYDHDKPNKPETHHSFFYLLTIDEIQTNDTSQVTGFRINTTQFRAWPNSYQALAFHRLLGQPISVEENSTEEIPSLLFANLIALNQDQLIETTQKLHLETPIRPETTTNSKTQSNLETPSSPKTPTNPNTSNNPESLSIKQLFQLLLENQSQKYTYNHTHVPHIPESEFWHIQKKYFQKFYLEVTLPIFEETARLQQELKNLLTSKHKNNHKVNQQKLTKEIQENIDFLDKAFFYYSKILLGWVKINNTNPEYTSAFKEKNKFKLLMEAQQKILLRVLGQKQTDTLPSISKLQAALDTDHRLATHQPVSREEKKQLLSVWSFFSFVGTFSSLLQCGAIAPFTLPITLLNTANKFSSLDVSMAQFSGSLATISVPEKQKLLALLEQEEYVELDLTKNDPPAKQVYTVPKSYLAGEGCIVGANGAVLGPCIDPATQERIPLDDPRDTLAFPMKYSEFQKYLKTLQDSIQNNTLAEIDKLFSSEAFSAEDRRKVKTTIKKLKQKMIKETTGLQEAIFGDVTNPEFASNNEWLQELVLKLSFSINPVQVLVFEVEQKLKEKDPRFTQAIEELQS